MHKPGVRTDVERFVVFGTGGVGGYFGARLAEAGYPVTFIARGDHLQAIRERGLTVECLNGTGSSFRLDGVAATDDPAQAGPADVVLGCVKAWQVPDMIAAARPLVANGTVVVPLQNGVDAVEQCAAAFGADHVLAGFCKVLAWREAPGLIQYHGAEPIVTFGEMDNRPSGRVDGLRAAFKAARAVECETPDDIHRARWEKFLFIAPLSGVGTVTRACVGVVRAMPETRDLLYRAVAEAAEIGRAEGVALADDAVQRTIDYVDTLPPASTVSMQRDIMAGRPSELEAQTGSIVRRGAACGVATPVNQVLYASLKPMEAAARGTS